MKSDSERAAFSAPRERLALSVDEWLRLGREAGRSWRPTLLSMNSPLAVVATATGAGSALPLRDAAALARLRPKIEAAIAAEIGCDVGVVRLVLRRAERFGLVVGLRTA